MNYDTICLSGGGIKGFGFIGALDYLNSIKYIDITKINNWYGTSAGAIFSIPLILGYSTREISDFILNFNFKKIEHDINIEDFLENYGINDGNRLLYLLSYFIESKYNIKDLTFSELYKLTNKKLHVVGTNFTKCCEELFCYENTPTMSIITAVRISVSIPVIFTPILYNNNHYIDGAFVNNFPIKYCNNSKTLGIYIKPNNHNELSSIFNLINGCIKVVLCTLTHRDFDYNNENIVEITDLNTGIIKFDLDLDEKFRLINIGQKCAKQYIDNLPNKICTNIINEIIDQTINQTIYCNKPSIQIIKKMVDKDTQTEIPEISEIPEIPEISEVSD